MRWKQIPGWEKYEVSDTGLVRRNGHVLKTRAHDIGYRVVTLQQAPRKQRIGVHRLVLMAFSRPPHEGEQVRHLDGCPWNNEFSNLAWGSAKANAEDKRHHGTLPRGESNGRSRLSDTAVREIFTDRRPQTVIAAEHKVTQALVAQIKGRKVWRHVTDGLEPGRCNGAPRKFADEIRAKYNAGGVTMRQLAVEYGTTSSAISYIVNGGG